MSKKIDWGNPTDTERFKTMIANAHQRIRYQRLLWKRLTAEMAEGIRDQSDSWRGRYVKLPDRAAKHELESREQRLRASISIGSAE